MRRRELLWKTGMRRYGTPTGRCRQMLKAHFGDASILKGGRGVFNIGGNKNRLVVKINYPYRVLYVRFVGTHAQYDDIDANLI